MRRPASRPVEEVCRGARRVVVIHGVVDTTNIGAIFRSAAALGIDAILLTTDSCDPLNRRAVRVSMGSVFLVPWTWVDCPLERLKELGFRTAAMALTDNSISIEDPVLAQADKLASCWVPRETDYARRPSPAATTPPASPCITGGFSQCGRRRSGHLLAAARQGRKLKG